MENTLEAWITTELQRRGWSIRELARRGGVSHTAINNALSGSAQLGTYRAIARGLGVPLVEVLQQAKEIPTPPEPVKDEDHALHLFRQVAPSYRDLALRVLDVFADASNPAITEAIRTMRPGSEVIIREWPADDVPAQELADVLQQLLTEEQKARLLEWFTVESKRGVRERSERPDK